MRRRSETIYAKSQDDFLKQMNEIDRQQLFKIQRRSNFTSKSDSSSESSYDESLGSNADFQISLRKLSLIEEEKEDEESLYEFISHLNLHLKNGKKKEFLKLLSSRVEPIKTEQNGREIPIQLLRNKILRSPRALLEGVLEDHSINTNSWKFVSENFRLYDNKLKFIVFGESGVGKTQMISYFVKVLNGERINKQKLFLYRHTESLEVHKKLVNISNRVTRLELWDTNVSIVNSSIFKCILSLKKRSSRLGIFSLFFAEVTMKTQSLLWKISWSYFEQLQIFPTHIYSSTINRLEKSLERLKIIWSG